MTQPYSKETSSSFEKIHGAFVEGRAENDHAQLPGAIKDGLMPFPGRVRLLVQVVKRGAAPQTLGIGDEELPLPNVQRHGVGSVGLKLKGVRTSLGGSLHNRQRSVQRMFVVPRHLSNDERRMFLADSTMFDGDGPLHHRLSLFSPR